MTLPVTAPDPTPADARRDLLTALARLEGRVDYHLSEAALADRRREAARRG